MRSQKLILNLQPSKIPIVGLILLFIVATIAMYSVPWLNISMWFLMAVASIYWLYKYLAYPYYKINIDTKSRNITLMSAEQIYHMEFLHAKSIAWWFTIAKFKVMVNQNVKKMTIPIFMDSIPLKHYKSFRTFALWT